MQPKRIQVSWKRMLEVLKQSGNEVLEIKSDKELLDFFAWGRSSTATNKSILTAEEINKLNDLGIDWEEDLVCLCVEKEVYPGKYYIGEF